MLNDFIFCPYSIYLHNVYMETDKDMYQAVPQIQGTIAHTTVDNKTTNRAVADVVALPVFSEELGVYGVIDTYKPKERLLVERKFKLSQIYQGQIYQLWAQCFCMIEMGYVVDKLAFYESSKNLVHPIPFPTNKDKQTLLDFIESFRKFDMSKKINISPNKCLHCIYCNLCDKTMSNNVYT